jgi:nitroreductase
MPNPSLSEILNGHRSIRSYKPDPIDSALVDQVCADAIAGASSSGNLNSVSLILTRDPERKQRLYELHFQQQMVLQAPLVVTFCADWFRTRQWLEMRGARDNFNNLLGYHVAAYDAMIIAQNVCLGFEAHGLGICYMGTTLSSLAEISELLDLPETCVPVTTIVVGYPDEDPLKRDRLPTDGMIHYETYHRASVEELEQVYAQREERGWERYMSIPGIKAAIEEHGITSLAQFYTSKIKYDPDVFAEDSDKIKKHLEEKGFLG